MSFAVLFLLSFLVQSSSAEEPHRQPRKPGNAHTFSWIFHLPSHPLFAKNPPVISFSIIIQDAYLRPVDQQQGDPLPRCGDYRCGKPHRQLRRRQGPGRMRRGCRGRSDLRQKGASCVGQGPRRHACQGPQGIRRGHSRVPGGPH